MYLEGNGFVGTCDYESASKAYSDGINAMDYTGVDKELLMKLLLNKAMCDLKLRLYDAVINDCSSVIRSDPLNVKGLLRRAMAYEYTSDYDKGLADVYLVLAQDIPNSFRSSALLLEKRLVVLNAQDGRQKQNDASGSAFVVTNKEQCLRINVLDGNCLTDTKLMDLANSDNTIRFRVCIGNEFGLWDRHNLYCSSCSSGDKDALIGCEHTPRLSCDVITLEGGGLDTDIGNYCTSSCFALDVHGKVCDLSVVRCCAYHGLY